MTKIIQITNHPSMGKWTSFFEVPSESNPSKAYIVSADATMENMGCSCPRWIYHRQPCKHINRLLLEKKSNQRFANSSEVTLKTSPDKLTEVMSMFAKVDVS